VNASWTWWILAPRVLYAPLAAAGDLALYKIAKRCAYAFDVEAFDRNSVASSLPKVETEKRSVISAKLSLFLWLTSWYALYAYSRPLANSIETAFLLLAVSNIPDLLPPYQTLHPFNEPSVASSLTSSSSSTASSTPPVPASPESSSWLLFLVFSALAVLFRPSAAAYLAPLCLFLVLRPLWAAAPLPMTPSPSPPEPSIASLTLKDPSSCPRKHTEIAPPNAVSPAVSRVMWRVGSAVCVVAIAMLVQVGVDASVYGEVVVSALRFAWLNW